ncbi:DNA primase [Candidatus Gracilibacteria bacterium]|nr:DNA primase [Candidatus Gracilibacteria bacterium]
MSITREIDEKINIVDLVSRYIAIKKAGVNYKALCPFHNEKTASFVISPVKNIAYCFSCHNGGGPVKFLSEIEKIPYNEALHKLAKEAGVEMKTDYYKEQNNNGGDILDLYKIAATFYQTELFKSENKSKLDYLLNRGLTLDTIKKFKIGYSDNSKDLFYKIKDAGFKDKDIMESGVFVSENRDKFYGRIVFPIANYTGNIVAFTGRVLDNSLPKYLNSPATKIFNKSSILFGLDLAKGEISKKGYVIIVEGQMDVISLHQAGFTNTVAISGTALTEDQIKLLKRITKKIYLCLDNDDAGIKAIFQSLDNVVNEDLDIYVVDLKNHKDPDELIKSGENFEDYIKNSLTQIGFYIKQASRKYDISGVQGKKNLIKDIVKILKKTQSRIEVDLYIRELSKKLDIGTDVIYEELKNTKLIKTKNNEILDKKGFSLYEQIMGYLTLYNYFDLFFEIFKYNTSEIREDTFSQDLIKLLKLGNSYTDNESLDFDKIKTLELFIEEENSTLNKEKIKKKFIDIVSILNKNIYEFEKNDLEEQIKKNPLSNELMQKYIDLLNKAKTMGLR